MFKDDREKDREIVMEWVFYIYENVFLIETS